MLDSMKSKMRAKSRKDALILLAISVLCLLLFSQIDALEFLYALTREHEEWELDELLSLLIVLSFLFAIFSFRRWQDIKKLSNYCEQLSMLDPITLLPNRRVVDRLLKKARKSTDLVQFPLSLILVDISGVKIIQSQFGNTIAEQAISELFYRYSLLLTNDQLICYRNTNQCLFYCPTVDNEEANILSERVCHMQLESHQTTLNLLTIKSVALTLQQPEEIDDALERLDDLLLETHFNHVNVVELKLV